MRKVLRIVGFFVAVALIVTYICYASHLAKRHRAEQQVTGVVVSITDSTDMQQFATSEQIHKQLRNSGLKIENNSVSSVDALKISEYIARNGFVREAYAYVTYSGEVRINIKQHKPVARLLCGGLNSYITSDGAVFKSPQGASYYTAVVTGGYRSQFVPKGDGDIESSYVKLMAREDERLAKLGDEFRALRSKSASCSQRKAELRKDRKRKILESKASHEQRKVAIDMDIAKCNEQLQGFTVEREQLERRQCAIEMRKKKLQKKYDDFRNLLKFVEEIEDDSFWRAEVVQFVADTTSTGEISLRLIPRSGDFVITLGTLSARAEKMKKLQKFYDNGLSHLGWDRFRSIDLRYSKQVICTE